MRFSEALVEAITLLDADRKTLRTTIEDPSCPHGLRADLEDRLERLDSIVSALKAEPDDLHPYINDPADVDTLLRNRIAYSSVEQFAVVLMDTKNRVISAPVVAIGGIQSCMVDPRSVFKPAITQGASSIVLAHNHPSGDTKPSREDIEVTNKIHGGAQQLNIRLCDHLILGRGFYSFKANGYL